MWLIIFYYDRIFFGVKDPVPELSFLGAKVLELQLEEALENFRLLWGIDLFAAERIVYIIMEVICFILPVGEFFMLFIISA